MRKFMTTMRINAQWIPKLVIATSIFKELSASVLQSSKNVFYVHQQCLTNTEFNEEDAWFSSS